MLTELDDEARRIINEAGALAIADRARSVTTTHLLRSLVRSTDPRLVAAFDSAEHTSERVCPPRSAAATHPEKDGIQVQWRMRMRALIHGCRLRGPSAVPYDSTLVNVLHHAHANAKGKVAPIEPRHLLLALLDAGGAEGSEETLVRHLNTPVIRQLLE